MCAGGAPMSKPTPCAGRRFVAQEAMSTAETRLLHLHIEKTGGTALRIAMRQALGPDAKAFPEHHESKLDGMNPDDWDLISGHFGYARLKPLGGRIVVLLRDPVDRIMSVYYYWRDMNRRGITDSRQSAIAARFSLDDFVAIRDDPSLVEQFCNRMTWMLADTYSLRNRGIRRAEGLSDAELLARALANLRACAVVGVQDRMDAFADQFTARTGLPLVLERLNATQERPRLAELSPRTRQRMMEWVPLDVELYQAACALAASR